MSSIAALLFVLACVPDRAPRAGDEIPVIRAEDPAWVRLESEAPTPSRYGLQEWSEVRGRVVHVAAALGREQARARALAGEPAACASTYDDAARRVADLVALGVDAASAEEARALQAGLLRDRDVCASMTTITAPADREGADPVAADRVAAPLGHVAALRARWRVLSLRFAAGEDVRAELRALGQDAAAVAERPAIGSERLVEPAGRAEAIVALVDALDPLFPSEPFGPWSGTAPGIAARAVGQAAAALAAMEPKSAPPAPLPADRAAPASLPEPLLVPSRAAARAVPRVLDAAAIGTVPSGDALVDVGGWPAPRPWARLQRMGLQDPAHRAWLEVQAQGLATFTESEVPEAVRGMVERFDRLGHTSRWYNVLGLRGGVASTLASRGAWQQARGVLSADEPPRSLDATVPAYAAARWIVDARLALLLGGDAAASLEAATRALDVFVATIPPSAP